MRTIFRLCIVVAIAAAAMSCKAFHTLTKSDAQNSQGKPYELIVVSSQDQWGGMVGDSLRALLTAPVAYLNQQEPLFDVLRVTERGFTGLVANHRNVLKVLVDPSLPEASVAVQYDVTAQPQIMMTLQGASDVALIDYLSANGDKIVQAFEMAERDRAVKQNAAYNNAAIESVIEKHFDFQMSVPKGYVLAKEESDFIWARYEYPAASQGFMIYSYPYAGAESLTLQALIAARNQYAAHIPGPSDGTYMTTSDVIEPDYTTYRVEGRPWIELRGFWDVAGDFMGGPFVSFTTVDVATNKVITLDCYVYSPKLHKRNFLRGVEHLLYGIRFPETAPKQ